MKTSLLAIRLHKFIRHSYVLSKVSEKYNRLNFITSLDKLLLVDNWMSAYQFKVSYEAVCKKILTHQQHLYQILPSTYNTSYNNSLKKLQEMIFEAEQSVDPVHQFFKNDNKNNGIIRAQR